MGVSVHVVRWRVTFSMSWFYRVGMRVSHQHQNQSVASHSLQWFGSYSCFLPS